MKRQHIGNLEVEGVAILASIPVVKHHVRYYRKIGAEAPIFDEKDKDNTSDYMLAVCDVEKEGMIFRIGTTHFFWTSTGEVSKTQRVGIQAFLNAAAPLGDLVLTGDFNAPRGGEIFAKIAAKYTDNIPPEYKTSIDGSLHRAGPLPHMVDGLFSTSEYTVSDVRMVSGVSDHCAIIATVSKT